MANYTNQLAGLTFGIELEFIAVYPSGHFHHAGLDDDIFAAISLAINDKGIKASGHESLDDDISINGDFEPFDSWTVSEERGLLLSEAESKALGSDGNLLSQGIEISSRKMWFAENWESEVFTVLNVLDSFRAQGCRFITNATTGFHVHIGFENSEMPLRTAKGVLELCTAFEDRLDMLYPVNRIDEQSHKKWLVGEHFNANLSWHFSKNIKTSSSKNVCHWLAEIEECTSFMQLGKFFRNEVQDTNVQFDGRPSQYKTSGPQVDLPSEEETSEGKGRSTRIHAHFSTLNLDNLYLDPELDRNRSEPMGTIEFRQHDGTLDFKEICAHVELLRTLMFAHVSNPEFRLLALLQAIGASTQLLNYYNNRFSRTMQDMLQSQAADAINFAQQHFLEIDMIELSPYDKLTALDAVNLFERWKRSNSDAVSKKVESKRIDGAYADLRTAPLDITGEFMSFVQMNQASVQDLAQLSTMARTMIFQQMNGSD